MGNRTETIRPDGQRIGYLHYGSGHLHGITLNRNEIAAFERDKLHRETERTFGKHIRQQTQYDPVGRILQQIHNRSRREYGYDAAGQLTHIQSRGGQTQYRYDPIGRLIAAVTPDFSETFAFDPADNRLDLSGNKQDHAGQANNSQEKPSLNKVWGNLLKEYAGVHYDYDQRGNLIRKTRNGETTDYHWNGYNQLIKIENRNGSTEYRYDPLGRRTAKIRNGETTVYHWQEDTLAIESTNGQNIHYLFEPGTFEPLAQFQTTSPIGIEREDKPAEPYSYDPETDPLLKIPPEPQEQSEAQPELVYYQLDHLGTPIAAHNAKGEAVWTSEYEAWGRIRNKTVSDGLKVNIPFRFQGQYYDEESGLHYNRFRYYDPEIARFVSQDPIGFAGSDNFYEYAPNPIRWVDPYGLAPCKKKVANPRINMEHIFQGEINRKGQATGFHHEGSIGHSGKARIIQIIQGPNLKGVYGGRVEIFNTKTAQWVQKSGPSTFYPKTWSRSKVISEIKSAYKNGCIIGNKFSGVSNSGITIEGYVNQRGYDINTAYPKY